MIRSARHPLHLICPHIPRIHLSTHLRQSDLAQMITLMAAMGVAFLRRAAIPIRLPAMRSKRSAPAALQKSHNVIRDPKSCGQRNMFHLVLMTTT
jgi:hypothetical protein